MGKRFVVIRILVILALLSSFIPVSMIPTETALADCGSPANEIESENCLAGNPASEWDISGAGDPTIQGFATDISVNRGGAINFKIDTTANEYEIRIYRLGYYSGNGARLINTIPSTEVIATDQLECTLSPIGMGGGATTSGQLLDCGNWSVSASWQVPADATSGVYIARPTRTDNGGASHIVFIVRDDASDSDLLFQTSDTTWQSYNPYGGYNAYGTSGATVAEKLSYNRPFTTRGGELENWLFNAEYPMIRWLERNGYDVSYMSALDVERHAVLIPNHKVYLSVGHDEYWSQGRRDAVTAARDAGVHLAFFSGNEIYWKIRWEDSATTGTSFEPGDQRIQVTYKEGSAAPSGAAEHRNCYDNYECDPSDIWTGLWREAPGSTPENSLSGQISWRENTESITVPGEYAPLRFWRSTDVANLGPTGQVALAYGTLGYEWDPEYPQYADWYPAGRVLLSTTTATSFPGIPEQHHLSLYRASSGALVFGAGTVQWAWGLDSNHDRGTSPEDRNVQQATVNLFADMGVQPATLQSNLTAATASTDTTPPVVAVTSPAAGSSVPGGLVTITGTASDVGGVVGVVEISTNGGTTWRRASGRENWSHTYTAAEGAADIRVRAADDSLNLSSPVTHTFTVESRVCDLAAPCGIWNDTFVPGLEENDANATEVGIKFRADVAGEIHGIRFYKTANNTGTHTGTLWTTTGANLGRVTFSGETATGWQEAYFATPVAIAANTTYVVSYHTTSGYYVEEEGYFSTSGADNAPLHALAAGVDGPNGVYIYASSPTFPTLNFNSSNYGVDVLFVSDTGPGTTPTPTSSPTPTATNTPTPTATNTPAPTATNTPTATATNTPTATATNAPTPTATNTPTPTSSPTPTATATNTPTATATNTPTATTAPGNTNFLSPSANAPVTASAGDNNGYEVNPSNAYVVDGVYAQDVNSGTTRNTSCTHPGKDKHLFSNFGITIPGSTVTGIIVRLDALVNGTARSPRICVQLSWDGGASWTAARSTATLTTSSTTYLLGGSTDTWGRAWTATELDEANFRVRVIDVASNTTRIFSLDAVAVQVFYR